MDGGVVDLAGEDGVVVVLGHDELQGVIAAAHIVHAGQLNDHALHLGAVHPIAELRIGFEIAGGRGKLSGQKAAVAGCAYRKFLRIIAGHSGQLYKVRVFNIQGQIHEVTLDDFGIGGDTLVRVAGIFGVLFVIGLVLLVHLPVGGAGANGAQPEAGNGSAAAQRALELKYGGNGCVAGNFNFAEISNNLCISTAYFICSTYEFIACVSVKGNLNFADIGRQCYGHFRAFQESGFGLGAAVSIGGVVCKGDAAVLQRAISG